MKLKLSGRAKLYSTEALKQILSVLDKPDLISLAGGLPAPESFPLALIKKLTKKVLDEKKELALQYSATAGVPELRNTLAEWINKRYKTKFTADNILVTTGSTQAMDLIAKIFLDQKDKIVVEDPSYLGALWAFDPYQLKYLTVESQADGINTEALEELLKKEKGIKFLYIVSTFQNPTGREVALSKRRQLVSLAEKYDFLIVEDDPYRYLRYQGEAIPPIKSYDKEGRVIYLSTFSKIFAPGFRVAFAIASKEIIDWLAECKGSADLCSATFNQYLVNEYIKGGYIEKQIKKNIRLYKPRYHAMLESLSKYFPKSAYWTEVEGGMFTWVELDEKVDSSKLYFEAVKAGVAFVPGVHFYAKKDVKNSMRLNFSNVSEAKIKKGVKILGNLIKKQ